MTRLRARGGVRDRPPIIDDDDEEMFRAAPVIPNTRKRKQPTTRRQQPAERLPVERIGRHYRRLAIIIDVLRKKISKNNFSLKTNQNI